MDNRRHASAVRQTVHMPYTSSLPPELINPCSTDVVYRQAVLLPYVNPYVNTEQTPTYSRGNRRADDAPWTTDVVYQPLYYPWYTVR